MGTWKWIQPGNRIWKVISDLRRGTIKVFDEKGNLLLKKTGLNKKAIEMIEKNFLDIVTNNKIKKSNRIGINDNPMYV